MARQTNAAQVASAWLHQHPHLPPSSVLRSEGGRCLGIFCGRCPMFLPMVLLATPQYTSAITVNTFRTLDLGAWCFTSGGQRGTAEFLPVLSQRHQPSVQAQGEPSAQARLISIFALHMSAERLLGLCEMQPWMRSDREHDSKKHVCHGFC